MAARIAYADVEIGTELPERRFPIRREDLIRYAGASGDFNPIHWNERFATSVGLPDVIAHGMLTMAEAARVITDWAGDPGALVDYGVRFAKPVVVPNDEHGAELVVGGTVVDKLDRMRVAVDLTARSGGDKVLARARAVVQLC
ncbi:MAG: MaoC family dehydratase [Actinobacteria bacterium]|nr:MaoC family dehydratase [Actinomycetota bacterium]MBI3685956.1 MaoC family dehydratase [Actinomycetota bacterium]